MKVRLELKYILSTIHFLATHFLEDAMKIEEKLAQMGLTLPEPGPPAGNYIGAVQVGNLLFVSGHGPRHQGTMLTGKVGRDLTTEQAYEAAKVVMLNCLVSVKRALGDLDRVKRIVKLLGMVNCTEDFTEQPKVINGASDLLVALYGEAGRHARSAVGMQQLPMNIPVEIEMIVEVAV
jgi:enamine deaminase RidA (YjgF/YER057c/UK114 family)